MSEERRPCPYVWIEDRLVLRTTGRTVATLDDFPSAKRQIELHERARERASGAGAKPPGELDLDKKAKRE